MTRLRPSTCDGVTSPAECDRYRSGMQSPDPASALSDDDQLSLWVGRVARIHALLEYNLSNVHGALSPPDRSSVPRTVPANVDLLVRECKRLLQTAELSGEVIEAGAQALAAAKAANALRNRIVHDIWLPDSRSEQEQAPSWITFRRSRGRIEPYASSTPRDLDTVISAHTTLVRCRLRVSGLFMALHEILPWLASARSLRSTGTELPRYVALMRDHFTLEANGDFAISEAK
jgi:hypothetical protein